MGLFLFFFLRETSRETTLLFHLSLFFFWGGGGGGGGGNMLVFLNASHKKVQLLNAQRKPGEDHGEARDQVQPCTGNI